MNRACGIIAALLATAVAGGRASAEAPAAVAAQQRVVRAVLESVRPILVKIETIGGAMPLAESDSPDAILAAPGFRQADGPTTGVICAPDGYILTSSFNFVRDPTVITVALHDGRRLVARLVARDHPAGLALLKIPADDLPVPQWASSSELRAGQWALVAGFGHGGAEPAVSLGILSALERLDGRAVQTDARTSPANYGGPLCDLEGRVIGICVPKAGRGDNEIAGVEWYDSGIGFAIRADFLAGRLPHLLQGTDLHQGAIGVAFDTSDPVAGAATGAADPGGVRVLGVVPGPAADAGVQADDLVVAADGQPVQRLITLTRILARKLVGETVVLSCRRGDETFTATLQLVTEAALRERQRPPAGEAVPPPAGEP